MTGSHGICTVGGQRVPIKGWKVSVEEPPRIKPQGEELLERILDNPDEDTHRLVYADWLDEQRRPERAEFIRVQVKRAATDPSQWEYADAKREQEILFPHPDAHQDRLRLDWLSVDFAMTVDSWKWDRGFVSQIWIRGDRWLTHADQILAAHPVREVTLTTWPGFRRPDEMLRDVYQLPSRERAYLVPPNEYIQTYLLKEEWPGIAFTLPPAGTRAEFDAITEFIGGVARTDAMQAEADFMERVFGPGWRDEPATNAGLYDPPE